jgi:two-component system, sensor histidine kinase and response regulator
MVVDGMGDEETDPDLVRRLFEASPDGLWVFDDDGITTFANARMAEIVGRRVEDLQGLPVVELLDELGREQFRSHLAEITRRGTGQQNVETRFSHQTGPPVWGLVSYVPLLDDDGHRTGWLHRVTPFTERKELVDTLQ